MSEISGENLAELEKPYRATVNIVLLLILVALILVSAAWFIISKVDLSLTSQDCATLWVTILFVEVGSFVLRRFFFNWGRLRNIILLKGVRSFGNIADKLDNFKRNG